MASTVPAPSSQKAGERPISFVLVDNNNPSNAISPQQVINLFIRPEDLTRTDTSRMTVMQTLGSQIWADDFGAGVPLINISGHTGWRRPSDPAAGTDDGADRFKALKDLVYTQWHKRRKTAVQNGKDPNATVQLQFADQLDSFACIVLPLTFVLRRSRTRPLLSQYQISMAVLSDSIGQPASSSNPVQTLAQQLSAGTTSLTGSINEITAAISSVSQFVDGSIASPIAAFMKQSASVFGAVQNGINSATGLTASLLSVGQLTAQCGLNIFRTLAAVASIPTIIKGNLMSIASSFSNIVCVLENVFTAPLTYPVYEPLYGSSNCSSTNGGLPPSAYAGLNPFQFTNPTPTPDAISATPTAQAAMQTMATTDVVITPPSLQQIGTTAATAAAGLVAA